MHYSKEARKEKISCYYGFSVGIYKESAVNLRTLGPDRDGTLLLHISRWSLNYTLFT
jgi:hypothetical protein